MPINKTVSLNRGTTSQLPAGSFQCDVLRTSRKTLTLYVKHQTVLVRCPFDATDKEVDEFISSNYAWILDRLKEERIFQKEKLKIENNRKIFFRAHELTIILRDRREKKISVSADKFVIQSDKINAAAAKIQLEDYLIDKASEYIIPRAKCLARHLGVNEKIKEVKLRKTKSKWGHCTSQGVIQFNWLIMLAPYSIIDYIITHEVCHLVHMDHSRHFWNLVESMCPGHKEYVTWLKNHEHRFWFE